MPASAASRDDVGKGAAAVDPKVPEAVALTPCLRHRLFSLGCDRPDTGGHGSWHIVVAP
jgi:hypothetical protein